MLYKLGKVVAKSKNSIIFESCYTGIVIYVSDINKFEINKFQKIFIYEYKNEYRKSFYGFKEFKERIFFEDLLSIQGVGPKTAMSVISSNWKEIMAYIASGDYSSIAKIPYVGLKTARQIVFEFQKKYENMLSIKHENQNKVEALKTLKTLGFNESQINFVQDKLNDDCNVEQMIEKAIEIISHEKSNHIIKT